MSCPTCGKNEIHWCEDKTLKHGCHPVDLKYAGRDGIDMVNHPPHYTSGSIECIDAIRQALGLDQFVGYCRGNAIKYLWRTGKKGNAAEDLRKAAWYATKAADTLEMTDD